MITKLKRVKLNKQDIVKLNLLKCFWNNISSLFYNDNIKRDDPKQWYCIPYRHVEIIHILYIINKVAGKQLTFLDVGCGSGHIVALANTLGFHAEGIELNKCIPSCYTSNITEVDAFEYTEYKRYDVIYCYQILKNPADLDELYKLIISKCKPGTVFIFVGQYNYGLMDSLLIKIERNSFTIYVKP